MLYDTVLLRTFAAICDFGSFTKAAREVNLTQSAVSLHIKRLEDQVGSQLIERSTHGIWLTEAGEVFLSYARRILALNREAAHRLRNDRGSVIRVGAPEYFDLHALFAVLSQFATRYPATRHQLELGLCPNLSALLESGELDIAIVSSGIGEGNGVSLRRERRIWAAGGTLQLDPEKPVPLALYRARCSWRQMTLDQLDLAGRKWAIVLQSTSTAGILSALNAGLAISVLPEYGLSGSLRALGSAEALPALPDFEFVLRHRSGCRAAQPLADMIVSSFQHPDDRDLRPGGFRCPPSDPRTHSSESLRLSCGSAPVTQQGQTLLAQ
jgi:DNA-binding transcriptional LysR family regulator